MIKPYYKTTQYVSVATNSFKPKIRALMPKDSYVVWVIIDLKKNQITLQNMCVDLWNTLFHAQDSRTWYKKVYDNFWHFLHYKCHISIPPNKKSFQTYFIKELTIMALTREDSQEYKQSQSRARLAMGILESTYSKNPIDIHDNYTWTGDIPMYFSCTGRRNKHDELWDIWMNSKTYDAKARKRFHDACQDALLSDIVFVDQPVKK